LRGEKRREGELIGFGAKAWHEVPLTTKKVSSEREGIDDRTGKEDGMLPAGSEVSNKGSIEHQKISGNRGRVR